MCESYPSLLISLFSSPPLFNQFFLISSLSLKLFLFFLSPPHFISRPLFYSSQHLKCVICKLKRLSADSVPRHSTNRWCIWSLLTHGDSFSSHTASIHITWRSIIVHSELKKKPVLDFFMQHFSTVTSNFICCGLPFSDDAENQNLWSVMKVAPCRL